MSGSTNTLFMVMDGGSAAQLNTCTAVQPGLARPAPERRPIERLLGLNEPQLIARLHGAVRTAVDTRKPSALLLKDADDLSPDRLLTVRPAREAGYAIVAVNALNSPPPSFSPADLAALFGLSPSEAEIALGLLHDRPVADIAQARGVQAETVRGQIKSLMRKMGLSSQKQLVGVLTRVAAALG